MIIFRSLQSTTLGMALGFVLVLAALSYAAAVPVMRTKAKNLAAVSAAGLDTSSSHRLMRAVADNGDAVPSGGGTETETPGPLMRVIRSDGSVEQLRESKCSPMDQLGLDFNSLM